MFNRSHTHNSNPFSNYNLSPYVANTTSSSTSDSQLNQLMQQLYVQQQMLVTQTLNKSTYIMGNKLYVNGLDIVRLI